MFTPLTGRTVLVTGGTKGIGKGIAGEFAAAGCNVALSGRGEDAGENAVRDLSARGGRCRSSRATSPRADDCERIAAEVVVALRRHRHRVRQRRRLPRRKLADMTEADIDAIFATTSRARC